MKQLNIALDDKLYAKWKVIAAERNTDVVPLVRSILQQFSPNREAVTIESNNESANGEAEIITYRGNDGTPYWFGTIYVKEKAARIKKWFGVECLEKEWLLIKQSGRGSIKICNMTINATDTDYNIVLGFIGVSKLG